MNEAESAGSLAAALNQATAMASMAQELKAMTATIQRQDNTLQELSRMKDAVTRMEVLLEGSKSTSARQFERIEKIEAEVDKVAVVLTQMSNQLAAKADSERVDEMDRTTNGFMNRIKGGLAVAGFVWVVVQGAIGWALVRFIDTTAANSMAIGLHTQTIDRIDRELSALKVLRGQ